MDLPLLIRHAILPAPDVNLKAEQEEVPGIPTNLFPKLFSLECLC